MLLVRSGCASPTAWLWSGPAVRVRRRGSGPSWPCESEGAPVSSLTLGQSWQSRPVCYSESQELSLPS